MSRFTLVLRHQTYTHTHTVSQLHSPPLGNFTHQTLPPVRSPLISHLKYHHRVACPRMYVAVSTSDLHAEGSLMANTSAEMSPVARQANAASWVAEK